MRYGVTARRKRNVRRVAELASLRQAQRTRNQAQRRHGENGRAAEGKASGKLVVGRRGYLQILRRPRDRARFNFPAIMRGDRVGIVGAERRRQNHAAQHC